MLTQSEKDELSELSVIVDNLIGSRSIEVMSLLICSKNKSFSEAQLYKRFLYLFVMDNERTK